MQFVDFLFNIHGRVRRRDFWLSMAVFAAIGLYFGKRYLAGLTHNDGQFLLAAVAVFSVMMITTKRFHDRGKSGWWILPGLVPVVGWAWMLWEIGLMPGTDGYNKYGLSPVPLRIKVEKSYQTVQRKART